jgi:hypothetical protein
MSSTITNPAPERKAVLFVRIQQTNKDFISKRAKESGFKDTASYLDALITNMKGEDHGKESSKKSSKKSS